MNADTPLNKDRLIEFLGKAYFLDGNKKKKCYVFVDNNLNLNKLTFYCNPGVPAMLLRSISQFTGKSMDELVIEDAVKMYNIINPSYKKDINYIKVRNFRKKENLSFFGTIQYDLLEHYLNQLRK